MPTSDAFKKKEEREKPEYLIIGAGGIRIAFSSTLYDEKTAEGIALNRSNNLYATLYRRNSNGKIYQVSRVGEHVEISRKTPGEQAKANRSMMESDPYIPGIQISSH